MDVVAQAASGDDGGEYLIFPSRSQDKKKNPLDPDTKIEYMQKFYPAHADKIMNDANTRTIFDVLKMAHNDGYTNVRIVGGSDRVKEFEKLSNNYNGQLYAFDNIEVLSSGERDPDAKGVEGMSASRMRLAAAEGDFNKFREGLPSDLKRSEAKELFDVLRGAMQVKEGWNVWEIAPKFDFRTLREKYIKKSIFNLGEKVQNLNTGLVGEISRRGTNYLICVTESGQMFKSWIRDLVEYKEQKVTEISGVPADQRLVGTDAHRKYVETMVPGHDWGKQFINKYRKSK